MTSRHHVHSMDAGRYLVLLLVVLASTLGDVYLSRGMRQIGELTVSRWRDLWLAASNPWIILGTVLLIVFFASYLSALSWADLSYIMITTALGNVLTALLAHTMLHERIPLTRWAAILLITFGVTFVSGGPSLTVTAPANTDEAAGPPDGEPPTRQTPASAANEAPAGEAPRPAEERRAP